MQTETRGSSTRLDVADGSAPRAPARRAPPSSRLRYVPGLDGLRALSVTAVLLYHADVSWMSGGFLGVDVFFVISGYLITSLLLAEQRTRGAVSLGQFYLRRARRLLPALFLLLATISLFTVIFLPDEIRTLRADVVAALGYVTNWWQIAQHQSYVAAQGRPPLLRHLWSLAVEEQFYLVWPLLLVGMFKLWGGRRLPMLISTGVGIALSFTTMLALSFSHDYTLVDPSRVYFGSDTRIFTMLIGAALAMVWSPWRLDPDSVPRQARLVLDGVGAGGVLALIVIFMTAHYESNVLFRGGFLGVALIAALVIAIAVHPASRLGTRVLALAPLRWVGERSYGIYLWHWPIFMITRPGQDTPITGVANLVMRFALTVGAAELSYRFVEEPVRHGAIGRWVLALRTTKGPDRTPLWQQTAAIVSAVVIAIAVAGIGLASGQPARIESGLRFLSVQTPTTTPATKPASTAPPATTVPGAAPTTPTTTPAPPAPAPAVTAIGDSVMKGAEAALREKIPNIAVDAAISRQFGTAIDLIRALKDSGQLGRVVVIHLGTNGRITDEHMDALKPLLADRQRVIFLNVKVPRTWEAGDNDVLQRKIPEFGNAVLINWNGEGTLHPEYFYGDHIHVNGTGMIRYAELVAAQINP